jgi:hypothetical protein
MIAAWHEVPGCVKETIRPVGNGMIDLASTCDVTQGPSDLTRVDAGKHASYRCLWGGIVSLPIAGSSCQATIISSLSGQKRGRGFQPPADASELLPTSNRRDRFRGTNLGTIDNILTPCMEPDLG